MGLEAIVHAPSRQWRLGLLVENRLGRSRARPSSVEEGRSSPNAVVAGRQPARIASSVPADGTFAHHDVSILMATGADDRERGVAPRLKVSMMIMRPPQQGHGCASPSGAAGSTSA
jgi:hypothetical protein